MAGRQLYDGIGIGYSHVRTADPRIEARLHAALGGARRVVNVGAGSGSYEPLDRSVTAVEPSQGMIDQRPRRSGAVRAFAASLPFRGASFDGALALLTVHHWPDPVAGLAELRRVTAGPIVVFTFDKAVHDRQWLLQHYLPEAAALDESHLASEEIAAALGGGRVEVLPVPHDCLDGFCHAWWRRPAAYLDPAVRQGISAIARLSADVVDAAMVRLQADLADGTWLSRFGHLLREDEVDAGYRLVISPGR